MLSHYYLTNNQVSKISKYAFQLPFKDFRRFRLLSEVNKENSSV